jgi:hypothetical protein
MQDLGATEECSCREHSGSGSALCDLPERVREFHSSPSESIDAMFQRFTVIVNNMRANVAVFPYDDHDRAVKLLHSLNRTVWSGKVVAILESKKYETLAVDELFPSSSRLRWTVGRVQRSRT